MIVVVNKIIKKIYGVCINHTKDDKIIWEDKYKDEDNMIINTRFFVEIDVEVYNYNKVFEYCDIKNAIMEEKCIICNENKPDVLFTRCMHFVVCRNCQLNRDYPDYCPMCQRHDKNLRVYFKTIYRDSDDEYETVSETDDDEA